MRTATVEIDKVMGTEFPPRQVEKDGRIYTLESIYEDAGLNLTVIRDQAELPVPDSGPNFDLPLLHEYMARFRKEQRDGWHAHILVVPNIEYAEGFLISRPLGVMYDFRSADLNNMPREGCAMSMASVSAHPHMYMRTLAHELGHVFNLLHPKHEIPPQPIGTSIMNQTADLQALGSFPDNILFELGPANKAWLRSGPAEFVMPGGRPFTDRPDDAGALVRDEAPDITPGLTLEISTRSSSYDLGEPLYLRITLRNDTRAPMKVGSMLSISAGTVDVWITTPGNRERRFQPAVSVCHEAREVVLPPGAEILASEPIFFGARGHSFPAPGTYKVRARYQANVANKALSAVAKRFEIEVRAPHSASEVDVADALASPSAALFLILRGGKHLRAAEDTLHRIVTESPKRAAAQHARIALASQALARHTLDLSKASSLLSGVDAEQLDRTHRAEYQRLVGLARACRGDEGGASDAVASFEKLTQASRPESELLIEATKRWIDDAARTKR